MAEDTPDTQAKPPVLIHTMGKVASSTVYEALKREGQFDVYHTHFLNPAALKNFRLRERGFGRLNDPPHIKDALRFRKSVLRDPASHTRVITLIRDPLARNISAFFNNFAIKLNTSNIEDKEIKKLQQKFMKTYPHNIPFIWFDREFKKVFGLDVMKFDFCRQAGFATYRIDNTEFVLMKVELPDQRKKKIVEAFLGCNDLDWRSENVGQEKPYAPVYKRFKDKITFSDEEIDRIYKSDFMKHFYTSEERNAFIQQWSAKTNPE